MKQIIFLISVIYCYTSINAQQTDSQPVKKNEIGLHIGSTTGLGLSYRHWFGKFGVQLTGIPIKTDNTEVYSVGATALYTFYDAQYIRVFGYLGNHYLFDKETGDDQLWKTMGPEFGDDDNDYNYYNDNSYYNKETYSIGFGPGFAFGKTVRFNIMIGYGFYDVLDKFEMYPCGEIGIYYRF